MNFIAAWLLTLMIVDLLDDILSLVSNSWIQRHLRVILLSAMYSASIVDNVTVGCFFEYQCHNLAKWLSHCLYFFSFFFLLSWTYYIEGSAEKCHVTSVT